jgi:MFS family permease
MKAWLPAISSFEKPYLFVWLLRACSALGGQALAFALALQLYQANGSVLDLGLLGLVQFAPSFVFAIPAGQLTDRFPPGRVAMVVQLLNALAAAVLLAPGLTGAGLTVALFASALVTGATRAFEHPINTALLPSVVAKHQVPAAIAWTTSVAKLATLVGPIIGGALYTLAPEASYTAALVLFLAAAAMGAALPRPTEARAPQALGLRSAFAGFAVIRRDQVLGGAMILDMLAVLLGGATALLPVYALDVLHAGPMELGILRAMPGVGAVVTGLWLARRPVERNAGWVLLVTTALFGALTCAFGLSRSYPLTLLLLGGIGAADMVSIHIRSALVQLRTPPELRGRVGAVNGIFISSSNQIGAFESGLTAYWFGLVPAVVFGGAAAIAVTAAIAVLFTPLCRVDRPQEPGTWAA